MALLPTKSASYEGLLASGQAFRKNFGGALYESHYYSAMGATMPYSAAIL